MMFADKSQQFIFESSIRLGIMSNKLHIYFAQSAD